MQDTITRVICKAAERELGQPIIVENKPGAAGAIGMNYALKSKPDGYTLVAFVTSAYNIIPHMKKVPYNQFTDSIDITTFFKYNFALALRAEAPWNTFEELITYAKNNPGKFKYACAGVGRPQHISMEWIAMKEGIKWTQIPYNSGSETVAACLGGHAEGIAQGSIDLIPHVKAGKMKLLLILEEKRWPGFPNVPCMVEKGYDFYPISYGSLAAPKGVPDPIIKKLEDAFTKAKRDPSVVETLGKFQVGSGTLTGKQYADLWRSKYDEMGKVIKALGLEEK
jgi:tripartite-type tricarboxylate transporter receptor subunit TctC